MIFKGFLVRSKVKHYISQAWKVAHFGTCNYARQFIKFYLVKEKWFFMKVKKKAELVMLREQYRTHSFDFKSLSSLSTWINFTSGWYLGGSQSKSIYNLAPSSHNYINKLQKPIKRKIWYNKKYIYILIWIILKLISKVSGKV